MLTLTASQLAEASEQVTITIMDVNGKQVSIPKQQDLVKGTLQLDISHLAAGNYILQIRIQGITQNLKFVKR